MAEETALISLSYSLLSTLQDSWLRWSMSMLPTTFSKLSCQACYKVGGSCSLAAWVVEIGSRWLSPGCRDEACIALLKVEALCFAIFVFIPVNDQLKPATSPHC